MHKEVEEEVQVDEIRTERYPNKLDGGGQQWTNDTKEF